jgi:pimeloyl-ACP methyl ester carboxylesterase
VPAATLARTAAGMRAWSRRADLGRVRLPTLVVVASEDRLTPDGGAVAAGIPGARRIDVAGVAHAVALEAPEEVTAAVLKHLAG